MQTVTFLSYFNDKVESRTSVIPNNIHFDVDHPPRDNIWSEFPPVAFSDLLEITSHMKLSLSPVDVIPAKFLVILTEVVVPYLLWIFNWSLSIGYVPDHFQIACVQPLLKKTELDPKQNYRPISRFYTGDVYTGESVHSTCCYSYIRAHSS